jgi:DNA mismatch endonuclease, patch repair protein
MTDILTPTQRSQRMSLIRGKNTRLERRVRTLIHSMGFRYRLHRYDLPGKPDLVFARQKKVIFVHGCFFHRHKGCSLARLPKSRTEYWIPKLEGNAKRDARNAAVLKSLGWQIMLVWECQIKNEHVLGLRVQKFLSF